jgi:broad specificity phosphatase PhoE
MPSNICQLYLVRHGATDANQQRPYILQGRGVDKPLNREGQRQARAVGRFLSRFAIHAVYASPLVRAVETARAIAGHHGLGVETLAELCECHVGRWEGKDWGTIEREFPEAYRAFIENPAEVPYLGGESYADVLARVKPALLKLAERHAGQSIAVVAHNVVNRVFAASILGLDLCKAKDLRQSNGCVNVVRFEDGSPALVTMNAEFHLHEMEQLQELPEVA